MAFVFKSAIVRIGAGKLEVTSGALTTNGGTTCNCGCLRLLRRLQPLLPRSPWPVIGRRCEEQSPAQSSARQMKLSSSEAFFLENCRQLGCRGLQPAGRTCRSWHGIEQVGHCLDGGHQLRRWHRDRFALRWFGDGHVHRLDRIIFRWHDLRDYCGLHRQLSANPNGLRGSIEWHRPRNSEHAA